MRRHFAGLLIASGRNKSRRSEQRGDVDWSISEMRGWGSSGVYITALTRTEVGREGEMRVGLILRWAREIPACFGVGDEIWRLCSMSVVES